MDGAPVSLAQGQLIEAGAVPGGITVQIISDSTAMQVSQPATATVLNNVDVPGVAETLLNISQPEGYITSDQATVLHIDAEQLQALQQASGGDGDGGQLLLVDQSVGVVKQEAEEPLEEERKDIVEDIKHQIRELCTQLADFGEESFLVTVRIRDGTSDHLGSIKGDHFCLLRQEILEEFQNFCLGIEDKKEDGEEVGPSIDLEEVDNEVKEGEKRDTEEDEEFEGQEEEEDMEFQDPHSPPLLPVAPKVIVMKKDLPTGKVRVDHQYTMQEGSKKVHPPAVSEGAAKKEPDKDRPPKTNILFLCDICKDVFKNLKLLKDHKRTVHDEGDHTCTECPRVFTAKKNLERHMLDAHSVDNVNKFLCDTCVMDFISKEDLDNHIASSHNPELGMKCDVCERTFVDINSMMEHRKLHFDYDCFCSRCWQGFFDFLELETHIQTSCRYKEALYKCDVCGKKYSKLHAINKHIDTHPIHSPHVCRMCGRGFESEKDLKVHRIAAHIIRPYKCEFCQKTFKKRESLIDHRRVHLRVKLTSVSVVGVSVKDEDMEETETERETVKYECTLCGIVMPTENTFVQHMLGHSAGNEEHRCDHCEKVFFSRSLLIVHCRKEHKIFLSARPGEETVDLLACDWEGCNKTFMDRGKWKYHMKYHQNRADKIARGESLTPQAEQCTCPICGKVLKYRSYLKQHMANHSGDKPHQCDICGTSYQNSKRLLDHIRVHKGEKPFKCRVCDKHFTSTSLRNQHMVVHWGSKTYICDICGKGFMSRKHFHDHMRIHNGEQPHKCETCGKDFIYYRSLVRHALTHIDPKERPKPYKCHYCGKEYTEVTGYKHHLRSVHTGETPFQCDICGEAFHRNDKLKRHMKSRHNRVGDKATAQSIAAHIVTTRRDTRNGAPIIIKTEQELARQGELQIIQDGGDGQANELHVDVIQENSPQVFLIGLNNEGSGGTTYLQETQVIEGPDGTRYIIAGSGEELQVIESTDLQQFQEGEVVQNGEGETITVLGDQQVTYSADQETLATLANMASVAEIADVVQQVE